MTCEEARQILAFGGKVRRKIWHPGQSIGYNDRGFLRFYRGNRTTNWYELQPHDEVAEDWEEVPK